MWAYGNNNPIRYVDPDGKDVVENLKKIFSGTWKVAVGGLGVFICGSATTVLVLDDGTIIGIADDGIAVLTAAGTVASLGYASYGLSEFLQGTIGLGADACKTFQNIIEYFHSNHTEKTKAKDRRRQEKEKSKVEKHLDPDWKEPASEAEGKWRAREKEKRDGKDGRREGHDRKEKGERDRSKSQLEEDYE